MTTDTAIKTRFLATTAKAVDEDTFTLSFSSENAVPTPQGEEILSHREGAVDLSRLNDGAPFLWNHRPDQVLGVVQKAEVVNGRGIAVVKWGTSPEAIAKRKEVAEKILGNISVGFQINEQEYTDDDKVLVTRWQPVEISLVAIPLDNSIGVRRSHPSYSSHKEETQMSGYVTDYMKPQVEAADFDHECRQFSIIEAAKGIASGGGLSGREREINQELESRTGRRTQGFYVPSSSWSQRAYTVGSATGGGNLVETQILEDQFVELLRAKSAVLDKATILPGLVGNVVLPTRTADNTAYWIAGDNADSVTESTGTFGTISLTPKTVGAYTKFSHLMKLQATPEIEQTIRNGIVAKMANAIDIALINGSGSSNQPLGILGTSGIGSVAIGTNGGAVTLDKMLDLKKEVTVDNGDLETCMYLTNALVENQLAQLKDGNSAYHLSPYGVEIGKQQLASREFVVSNNVPSNLTKGSASGTCSAVLYGNFRDLYVGMWQNVEIMVDPYTDFAKGTTGLRALASLDCGVGHVGSFAAIKDVVAT